MLQGSPLFTTWSLLLLTQSVQLMTMKSALWARPRKKAQMVECGPTLIWSPEAQAPILVTLFLLYDSGWLIPRPRIPPLYYQHRPLSSTSGVVVRLKWNKDKPIRFIRDSLPCFIFKKMSWKDFVLNSGTEKWSESGLWHGVRDQRNPGGKQ